jgi:vancomycin permeability regulator SanA
MRKSPVILLISISLMAMVPVNYYIITWSSSSLLFDNFDDLPSFENVLVFGAGRMYPSDHPNYAFESRMSAAEKISAKKSIKYIILSGRNEPPDYNETDAMRTELANRISGLNIIADTAASTIASLLNYKKKYGSSGVILISSKAHLERALFYSRFHHINAVGLIADDGNSCFSIRESFARLKTTLHLLLMM